MQFQTFSKQTMAISPIFKLVNLDIIFGKDIITAKQLSRWSKKGYLIKLKNGLYILGGHEKDISLFLVANLGYEPSYISLESALYEYGLIPDVVLSFTSVSTGKTYNFTVLSLNATFFYRQVKKEVFIGYYPRKYKGRDVFFAEPEKAILDYLYLHKPLLRNENDIKEVRFNYIEMKEKINKKKLLAYAGLFANKRVMDLTHIIIKNF